MTSKHITDLQDAVRRLHGVESRHMASVPVKEAFQGRTVWEGGVEVLELTGHRKAARIYAWTQETGDPKEHDTT